MRRLLGVLDAGKDPRALAPQPGLADLAELLARTRAAGLDDRSARRGRAGAGLAGARPVRLPDRPGGADQRDQARRPGPRAGAGALGARGARARGLRRRPRAGRGRRGPSGHGIAGMRERAALHGGSVDAGAGASGGFAVRARLPLARSAAR